MKKVIVFGSFDPLHEGHVDFFKQAKELGDFLTVVVARDENIRSSKKHEPMFDEKTRLEKVRQQSVVDEAMLGDEDDEYSVLDNVDPDIIAVGYDQKIPEGLKNILKKYKIVTLKPFKSEIYKSSKIKEGEIS